MLDMRATWAEAASVVAQLVKVSDELDRNLKLAQQSSRSLALLARKLLEVLASSTAVLLVAGSLAACGGGHQLQGTFTLKGQAGQGAGACVGRGGYEDIQPGAGVTVKDESGKILGTSKLGDGKAESGSCVFDFSVDGLPDSDFYQVEVSHRGNVNYSRADLDKRGWKVGLELGS